MRVADFDYELPPGLIAQRPADDRSSSRLLVLRRATGAIAHHSIRDLPSLLSPDTTLVVNNTRVIPARLMGHRTPSGGVVECLLLGRAGDDRWEALMHPGQKLRPGGRVVFERDGRRIYGEVLERHFYGRRLVRLWPEEGQDLDANIEAIGDMPLPPYIKRAATADDRQRYQTVFARIGGSVAAPTAGLHFTDTLLQQIDQLGVTRVEITLHVGYGTFKPVRTEIVEEHQVDAETYTIDPPTAASLNTSLEQGRRVIAVGTTTVRALESAAKEGRGRVEAGTRSTDLFIYPGFDFQVVQGMLTNFHLPRSSLLMLVCALAGRERVLDAYRAAVEAGYRFYSYGDAMLIL